MDSWREKLLAGQVDSAWKEFIAEHERLIRATIRRTLGDDDDTEDVFSEVCSSLSNDGMARLSRHDESRDAKLSTWLVTVVHHCSIDWVRRRDGRHRLRAPSGLSALQMKIFSHVFVRGRSHVETFEEMRNHDGLTLKFGEFLRELSATYRRVEASRGRAAMTSFARAPFVSDETTESVEGEILRAETGSRLAASLSVLDADERLAVQLFVIDDMPAERVASIVGWPNAKSVYNRVYRALAAVKKELERSGFDRTGDS